MELGTSAMSTRMTMALRAPRGSKPAKEASLSVNLVSARIINVVPALRG